MTTSLAGRVESFKLAQVLGVHHDELAFLSGHDPEAIRQVRTALGEALFRRHESRFRRVGKLATSVPAPLAAKIAQLALGPMLAARVAACMDPKIAVKLAGSLTLDYLMEVSIALDPVRAEPILDGLPEALVVDVGRRLLERGEHLTLGRFISVIAPEVALQVVEAATGPDLLAVALHADDSAALDVLVARIDEELLVESIQAAHETRTYADAITLAAHVSETSRGRLVPLIVALDEDGRDGFVRALHEHDVWAVVLGALSTLDDDALAAIANTKETLGAGVLDRAVTTALAMGLDGLVERLPGVLDDAHRAALRVSRA